MPFDMELYNKLVVCSKEEDQAGNILSNLADKYNLYANGDVGYLEVSLEVLPISDKLKFINSFVKQILYTDYDEWEISQRYVHLSFPKQQQGYEEYCKQTKD